MEQNDKIVIYQTSDGQTSIDVKLENETVWLSANQMALLFERDEKTIRKHINNVFSENELTKDNNTHFLRVDGVKQPVAFYTLDVIISVGYRVKSRRGTQFRNGKQSPSGIPRERLCHKRQGGGTEIRGTEPVG